MDYQAEFVCCCSNGASICIALGPPK